MDRIPFVNQTSAAPHSLYYTAYIANFRSSQSMSKNVQNGHICAADWLRSYGAFACIYPLFAAYPRSCVGGKWSRRETQTFQGVLSPERIYSPLFFCVPLKRMSVSLK